jgi:fatty acyl-CoA reductase
MTQAQHLNSVQEFYRGKTVFVTGASGFMGKVLVEKLLYSCSDLKQLIILMRVKKGKTEAARVKEFEALPVSRTRLEPFLGQCVRM